MFDVHITEATPREYDHNDNVLTILNDTHTTNDLSSVVGS